MKGEEEGMKKHGVHTHGRDGRSEGEASRS